MKTNFFLIQFFLGIQFCAFAQSIDVQLLNKGIELKTRGEYKAAIIAFDEFVATYPTAHPNAYYHRGYSNFYLQNYRAAIKDFEQLQRLQPLEAKAPYALGQSHYKLRAYQKAFEYFTKTTQLDPYHFKAFNDRGLTQCHLRNFTQALDDFHKAVHLDSTFAMAYNNIGAARYFKQDIAKPSKRDIRVARDWFSKAIKLEPTLALAYRNRGAMHIFLGDYDSALSDLNMASKRTPKDAMIYFYEGVIYADQKNNARAIAAFEKALTLNSTLVFAYEEIGNLHKENKNTSLAVQQYKKCQTIQKSASELYTGLIDYRIALVYAEAMNKKLMYDYLKKARRHGAFADMQVYRDFSKAKEFNTHRREKKFRRFTKSIRRGKKENKFLNPDLGWFRMRK